MMVVIVAVAAFVGVALGAAIVHQRARLWSWCANRGNEKSLAWPAQVREVNVKMAANLPEQQQTPAGHDFDSALPQGLPPAAATDAPETVVHAGVHI